MKRKNKKQRKKIFGGLILLLVVGGGAGYAVWQQRTVDSGAEEIEEMQQYEQEEGEEVQGQAVTGATPEKKAILYEGEDPNTRETLSGVVTYAGAMEGKLAIRVNIDQYLTDGECSLALKKGGNVVYVDTVRIIENVTTATCEGFDIATAGIGGGKFEIQIDLQAGEKKGTIKGEVDI